MQTQTTTLDALLARLRKAGEDPPQELFDEILAHGEEAIPSLIALATDDLLYLLEDDIPDIFAPYHAVRLLGELRAVEAIGPLMTLLEKDDDYIDKYLPSSLAQIGRPAVEPLRKVLFDSRTDVYGGARAANALMLIADREPALEDELVQIMIDRIDSESSGDDHEALRGFLVTDLADRRAVAAKASIERAYDADLVDETIIDRETYAVLMNRPEGMSADDALAPMFSEPRMENLTRGFGAALLGLRDLEAKIDEPSTQPAAGGRPDFGRKVGRNEQCPCGSGKKYKRCHGR